VRGRLLQNVYRPVFGDNPPWNDPHTAAPALRAYRLESGAVLGVCASQALEDRSQRRGFEDALLWRHRRATGRSVLCNYGRFHPKYRRPSNRQSGRPMTRREEPKPELNSPCAPPLPQTGQPTGPEWMDLDWSSPEPFSSEATKNLPMAPGLYRIFRPGNEHLAYLGETSNLRQRLRSHARRDWGSEPRVSVATIAEDRPDYHRAELESDLLDGHIEKTGPLPPFSTASCLHDRHQVMDWQALVTFQSDFRRMHRGRKTPGITTLKESAFGP
jgi:hypothetical protein